MKKYLTLILLFLPFFVFATVALDPNDPRWKWMDEQIEEQFSQFKNKGIRIENIEETLKRAPTISFGDHLLRFQILDGKVYEPEYQPWTCPKFLLEKVASLYPVPDVDVILFAQDVIWTHWLLTTPVFSTCKIKGDSPNVILMPIQLNQAWEESFIPEIEKANLASSWETKNQKLFWRGLPNDGNYNDKATWFVNPRGKLCHLSLIHGNLIDAAFSNMHAHQVVDPLLKAEFWQTFPQKGAKWEDYLNNKYLIDLDGCCASTPGCAWKLLTNCAVFKHDSNFLLWYYKILKPWEHYVPVKNDISDVLNRVIWSKSNVNNDAFLKTIADNGRKLALENLMPEHIYLYCYKALCKYASLQKFKPTVSTGNRHVDKSS